MFDQLDNLDVKINNTLTNIQSVNNANITNKENENLYSDVVNNLLQDDENDSFSSQSNLESLLNDAVISQDRNKRYNIYDEMVSTIPLIKRIMKVYISNILYKNPVNGKSLLYKSNNNDDNNGQELIKKIVDDFDILYKLKHIILPSELKYGDCFVEIINLNDDTYDKLVSKNVLNESELKQIVDENTVIQKCSDCFLETNLNVTEDEKTNDFSNIIIRVHSPRNIISLETNYGSKIGYLEITESESMSDSQNYNIVGSIIKQLTYNNSSKNNTSDITTKLAKNIIKNVLQKNNISNSKELVTKLKPDVYSFIKRTVIEQNINTNNDKKVRFIPIQKMVSFTNVSSQYYPYGESVFDSLILPSKLYILTQLANTVTKLSRSAMIRKWTIDTGSSLMQSNTLQKIKREIYNSRITLNDLSNFKSIPKILSDFKDMFVFSKQGTAGIDLDLQQTGDASISTQDLEDYRRELISLSGIPAPLIYGGI